MESCLRRQCFKYLGLHVSVDGGIEGEVKFRMSGAGKVCGGMDHLE